MESYSSGGPCRPGPAARGQFVGFGVSSGETQGLGKVQVLVVLKVMNMGEESKG